MGVLRADRFDPLPAFAAVAVILCLAGLLCQPQLLLRPLAEPVVKHSSGADRGGTNDERRTVRAHLSAPVAASRVRDRRLIGGYGTSVPLAAFFGAVFVLLGSINRCRRGKVSPPAARRRPLAIRGGPRPFAPCLLQVFRL